MGRSSYSEWEPDDVPPQLPPARTRERRVQQLVYQAENLIEKRIQSGKASPTEVVAVLRLGTEMEQAQLERVRAQTEYLHAQRDKAQSEMVREEMFTKAIDAITRYQGGPQEA